MFLSTVVMNHSAAENQSTDGIVVDSFIGVVFVEELLSLVSETFSTT